MVWYVVRTCTHIHSTVHTDGLWLGTTYSNVPGVYTVLMEWNSNGESWIMGAFHFYWHAFHAAHARNENRCMRHEWVSYEYV